MFKILMKRGAIVILTPTRAYKRYKGKDANLLANRQMDNFRSAASSGAWSEHVLESWPGPFSTLVSRRAGKLNRKDAVSLHDWVDRVTSEAMDEGELVDAIEILDHAILREAMRDHTLILDRALSRLKGVKLPSGPTHGDLHWKNVMKERERFVAIDLDRFRSNGCPLFDRLHFQLFEAKQKLNKGPVRRWKSILMNRFDIVESVADGYVSAWNLQLAYGLQRIALETEARAGFEEPEADAAKSADFLAQLCDLHEKSGREHGK